MSLETRLIALAKKVKKQAKRMLIGGEPSIIFPVRRINNVKLNERICSMTFDDGPFNLKANPARDDTVLTIRLLEVLEKHGARGTFDCIGDTSENYPDTCGDTGTPLWSGVSYDHYPEFEKDAFAGVKNCPEITARILSGSHEITSHSYVHRIWGKKPFVYQDRKYIGNIEDVVRDLHRFDDIMKEQHGYNVMLGRPPHYVDRIDGKFTSYDAYAMLGYQYLGASPDGGGWLPKNTYEEEVEDMRKAIANPLALNGDAFCGQIIFQKDGYNMAKRTPVSDALDIQLDILDSFGYKVITVSELLRLSQFSDISPEDEGYDICSSLLEKGMCPAFTDNCIHLDRMPSKQELAMLMFGWEAVRRRVFDKANGGHVYKYALNIAAEKGINLDEILNKSECRLDAYKIINAL